MLANRSIAGIERDTYLIDAAKGAINLRFLEDLFGQFATLENAYYTHLIEALGKARAREERKQAIADGGELDEETGEVVVKSSSAIFGSLFGPSASPDPSMMPAPNPWAPPTKESHTSGEGLLPPPEGFENPAVVSAAVEAGKERLGPPPGPGASLDERLRYALASNPEVLLGSTDSEPVTVIEEFRANNEITGTKPKKSSISQFFHPSELKHGRAMAPQTAKRRLGPNVRIEMKKGNADKASSENSDNIDEKKAESGSLTEASATTVPVPEGPEKSISPSNIVVSVPSAAVIKAAQFDTGNNEDEKSVDNGEEAAPPKACGIEELPAEMRIDVVPLPPDSKTLFITFAHIVWSQALENMPYELPTDELGLVPNSGGRQSKLLSREVQWCQSWFSRTS